MPDTGGFCFFVLYFFDVRLLIQTHIPASCEKFSHHIITHKEFDIHLRKVAAQREAGIGSPPKRKGG